jgi:signal transduction histidine kinase
MANPPTLRRATVVMPPRFDVLLALLLAALALADVASDRPPEPTAVAVVAALGTTLPVALRTVAPAWAALLATGALLFAVVAGTPDDQPVVTAFAPLVSLFALGEQGSARQMRTVAPLCVLIWSSAGIVDGDAGTAIFGFCASLGAIAVGRAARLMTFETDVLEARIGTLQEDQERVAREAVAAERERIARELHDVIGHSISVMGVQAGAVRRVLPVDLHAEREMLEAIERTGRDSVAEMQRLIDLLRETDATPDHSLPTLARVNLLVDEVRRAGLNVTLEVDGELDDLTPGRSLAGYRIVQEALTNALKHAPDARVQIHIRRSTPDLEIEVLSTGSANGRAPGSGGRGLIGMRERAALYNGTLDAGRTADGFRVLAKLPAEAS